MTLFDNNGAEFSACGKYRYALWRIWDETLPLVMVIGLNPSKADSQEDDNTIKRVRAIATNNGYGGFYMTNCFAYISTHPKKLLTQGGNALNDEWLVKVRALCKDVIFAWGNFKVVRFMERDIQISKMFPDALALFVNKNGSPKHPLFCRAKTIPVPYKSAI